MKMEYATFSRLGRQDAKLLYVHDGMTQHLEMKDLVDLIPENSCLVINNTATLPASFFGYVGSLPVELRLVKNNMKSRQNIKSWQALLFYKGSWKEPTEDRLNPNFIEIGDIVEIGDLCGEIKEILHPSKRFIEIEFKGEMSFIWNSIYRYGKPIQYSHLTENLSLWDVQTIFSSIPVSVEPASASFQFSWNLINELLKKGIEIVSITHATSISSTGIEDLDELLPYPEYYWIDNASADVINTAIVNGKEMIAVGTSVTRALEDNYTRFGKIIPGSFETDLVIDNSYSRKIITHLFTGMHLPEESHVKLLLNFVEEEILKQAYQEAIKMDYLWHEYGDVSFIKGK